MKRESLFHRFLIKIGLIKEASETYQNDVKKELCLNAKSEGLCDKNCESCAWGYRHVES